MDITYLGHSSFKIKTKTATVITDPFDSEMVGIKFAPNEAEIVTISHQHKDHNSIDKISGIKKVVDGPGEYEIGGVSIVGYPSFHDAKEGVERGKNTIYVIEAEGLRLVHLGDLGHTLTDDLISEMGSVDVLMIPTGGTFTIGPKEASEIAGKIDPYYILPMHYKDPEMKSGEFDKLESNEAFLKEIGIITENLPKLSVKKENITEDQSTKVILLERK